MTKVLFVCMGNICRSPAGEAVLRKMAEKGGVQLTVASCGLGHWHVGQLADSRMRHAALQRGWLLESKAQQFAPHFFDSYDYILAADQEVLSGLKDLAKSHEKLNKVYLMTAFSETHLNLDVPDPYYGGDQGFEEVLDLLENACQGFLEYLQRKIDETNSKAR